MKSNYAITMAHYNQWMNKQLYTVSATLTEDALTDNCGLFFKSVYSTLNHLLVCDCLWLARFTRQPSPIKSIKQDLFSDFNKMTLAREETDRKILHWANGLVLPQADELLDYVSLTGEMREVNFMQAIMHFFNHQTHHRGQVTAALSQKGVVFGITDLIFMPSEI